MSNNPNDNYIPETELPKGSPNLTKPALVFVEDQTNLNNLQADITNLITDWAEQHHHILDKPQTDPEYLELMLKGGNFLNHTKLLTELTFCRAVDNYLIYLSQLLAVIYKEKPDSIKALESPITTKDIFSFSTIDDLIAGIVEAKIEQASRQGAKDLFELFSKHHFKLFETSEYESAGKFIIEIRNVIVHNRGRITKVFKDKFPSYTQEIGDRIIITNNNARNIINFLVNLVIDIDNRAAKKFNLPVEKS